MERKKCCVCHDNVALDFMRKFAGDWCGIMYAVVMFRPQP